MEGLLQTITEIVRIDENTVEIRVKYNENEEDSLPNTIQGIITEYSGTLGDVSFKKGELIMIVKNHPEQINYQLDQNGHLILFTSTGDANRYHIDEMGYLIYNKEV